MNKSPYKKRLERPHQGSQGRKARVCALQMMYQWEVGRDTPANVKASYWREVAEQDPREYANKLFDAATSETAALDELIAKYSRGWKVERLTSVDRNLLRLALTEFRHSPEQPREVVINEAIEIAKMFSSDESHEFLNGVLDAISKEANNDAKTD